VITARAVVLDKKGGMNKLEAAYAAELELRLRAQDILCWSYESVKLKLADGTWYTPDFLVVTGSGELEMHETKGFMREAARVRLNVAAALHPFRFVLVRKAGNGWTHEVVA
jgi:hypothetical protein